MLIRDFQLTDRDEIVEILKLNNQYGFPEVDGPYDFVNIVEAPNNETIAKVSIELGSRGTIKIVSMAAIPIDEFIAPVKKR